MYSHMVESGLFQEWFGYVCVDQGEVPGRAGADSNLYVFRKLRRDGLWPISEHIADYSEDDIFDITEFLFDHASEGVDGFYHQYVDCGWHFNTFDAQIGREKFRREVNDILRDYGGGYEISVNGEILAVEDDAYASLLAAPLPLTDPINIYQRVEAAKLKYRRRALSERKDAVRDLADVLEFLREEAKSVLHSKDEADIFNIANNFGIRHHNKTQKTIYDTSIWLSWTFYYYLATIHACVRLIERSKKG